MPPMTNRPLAIVLDGVARRDSFARHPQPANTHVTRLAGGGQRHSAQLWEGRGEHRQCVNQLLLTAAGMGAAWVKREFESST